MREVIDRAHLVDAKPAGPALIGERAVEEAVAQHPSASFERRPDGLVDMVGARRGEQQGLGRARPAVLAALAAAARGSPRHRRCRPARGFRRTSMPRARSAVGERLELGRLADPLPAFEGDELARGVAHAMPSNCLKPDPDAAEEARLADILAGDQRHHLLARVGGGDDQVGDMLRPS